jgi:hypothetical protein
LRKRDGFRRWGVVECELENNGVELPELDGVFASGFKCSVPGTDEARHSSLANTS